MNLGLTATKVVCRNHSLCAGTCPRTNASARATSFIGVNWRYQEPVHDARPRPPDWGTNTARMGGERIPSQRLNERSE
jgi:hypothetical protein